MHKFLSLFSLFTIICFHQVCAQIFPHDGSILNYRLVGFSFPEEKKAIKYKIEIANGDYYAEDSFRHNIINSIYSDRNKKIIEVPAFGCKYTWRITYNTGGSTKNKKSKLFHFSTGSISSVDTNLNRFRVTVAAGQYKDAFVFVDAVGVLYDMSGHPIWYLPAIGDGQSMSQIRDLKCSPFGTITFIMGSRIYEINYDGKVLWKKPQNDTGFGDLDKINTLYHHEFTRCSNGHYMVLGSENLLCKLPSSNDSSFYIIPSGKVIPGKEKSCSPITFGTLIEYDETGKEVWLWRTAQYVIGSDLVYNDRHNSLTDLHDNSFFFDEQNNTVYLSFKGISRVIKIKYPEGSVLNTYGVLYNKYYNLSSQMDIQENRYSFFCGQHACRYSADGYFYLFDNGCDLNSLSKIVMMQEPRTDKDSLKKVWEYTCSTNDIDTVLGMQPNIGGGNVTELPDRSLFAAMGYQCNKVFIVNPDKNILWSAISEKYDQSTNVWRMLPSYRSSIITNRKNLEEMIWNSEKP